MGIVITGASGFLGRNILPILQQSSEKLLLVGRDKKRLQSLFPGVAVTSYDNLATVAEGFDTLLHLAVRNNDVPGEIAEFREVNVKLLGTVVHSAKAAGIKTIIYTTTLKTREENDKSAYTQSKREAEDLLSRVKDMAIVNLRLPACYSSTFTGKLGLLMRIPAFLRPLAFNILASLKPTAHVNHVAAAILNLPQNQENSDLIVSDKQMKNWFYAAVTRAVDLCFAIVVIAFFWWFLIAVWLAVKLSSPGSGIFAQERIGRGGDSFTCYKFRTMAANTKQAGTHEVSADSVTFIGRILRKTKIDELPQVWNILKNELSLVGPRPCLVVQEELLSWRHKLGILEIKPGITGLAQIQGIDMSDPEKLAKLDEEYVKLRTLTLDFKILLSTALGGGQGDKTK